MLELFNCDNCNQVIQRAHINEGKFYCVQCLSHQWQDGEEAQALLLIESSVDVPEVEVLNEALVLLP